MPDPNSQPTNDQKLRLEPQALADSLAPHLLSGLMQDAVWPVEDIAIWNLPQRGMQGQKAPLARMGPEQSDRLTMARRHGKPVWDVNV